MSWIAFDGNDFETFSSKEEALAWAEEGLSEYRDMAVDGWPEEVTSIVVAKVVASIVETERRPVQPDDQCYLACDEFVDYELVEEKDD